MTHTEACCCVHCERIKQRLVNVDTWVAAHQYHPEFIGVFEELPFPHESGEWFWLSCVCGAKVLVGTSTLPIAKKKPRKKMV